MFLRLARFGHDIMDIKPAHTVPSFISKIEVWNQMFGEHSRWRGWTLLNQVTVWPKPASKVFQTALVSQPLAQRGAASLLFSFFFPVHWLLGPNNHLSRPFSPHCTVSSVGPWVEQDIPWVPPPSTATLLLLCSPLASTVPPVTHQMNHDHQSPSPVLIPRLPSLPRGRNIPSFAVVNENSRGTRWRCS